MRLDQPDQLSWCPHFSLILSRVLSGANTLSDKIQSVSIEIFRNEMEGCFADRTDPRGFVVRGPRRSQYPHPSRTHDAPHDAQ